nr:TonB-dependent receptor plug domain-containing protein [uncultured Flavobacterium sp.]
MFKSFSRSKKYNLLCFLWIVLSVSLLQAQDKKSVAYVEKVYLHTDRTRYFVGEDLWYKAYNVRAYNNILFDNSNILYVELISPEAKIIARNKTNLEMGLGHGDFQLQDSLGVKPGVYQIRAYTNWNRNFGEDFVFKKNIEIIDAFESHSKPNAIKNSVIEKKAKVNGSVANKESSFKVDFFPEGGSLIENVASVVGFKAIDSGGNPINITGEIVDSNDELVTMFLSPHDGMGKFQILPIEGKKYFAKIKSPSGDELKLELPNVLKQGYLLNFRSLKGRNIVSITTNEATLAQNPNAVVAVVCKSKGVSYFESEFTLTKTILSFELPKEKILEGISQITVYDNNTKPQSERLVYIEKEADFDVQLAADKMSYQPNEKTTINVSSKSKIGEGKAASFSLSVADMNGEVEDKDLGTSISSYFLMESDIRGKVHHPGYYFDTANPKRLEYLDNLLLTQGWRDFAWKTMPKANDTIDYKAEKAITISGRVKQLLGEKPLVNINLTLALINKKNMNIFNTVTDVNGGFKFENIMFSGKTNMFLNSRNEKGKFRGEIIVSPIEQTPISVLFQKVEIDWTDATQKIVDNVFKKNVAFGIQPENILNEVKITGKKKNTTFSLHGIPDFSYVVDDKSPVTNDIYNFIQFVIPGVITTGNSVRFMRFEEPALFILDGFPVINQSDIDIIQPVDIEKIEALKGPGTVVYGSEGANGVIAIYLKKGVKPAEKGGFNKIKKEIDGFYNARVFYMPNPEKPNPELDNIASVRNTIYWNPYVHPDKTGNVTVSFDNTKVETKVKVDLEGITASGIPVVKKFYYTIKK